MRTAAAPRTLLTNVTITDNRSGGIMRNAFAPVGVVNTVIANNADGNCNPLGLFSFGHNLSSDSSCDFTEPTDRMRTDPLLGPLQDNGGATSTQALRPGSPLIDRGDSSFCPVADQRGAVRPADGDHNGSAVCDIGAYELHVQLVFLPAIISPLPDTAVAGSTARVSDK